MPWSAEYRRFARFLGTLYLAVVALLSDPVLVVQTPDVVSEHYIGPAADHAGGIVV